MTVNETSDTRSEEAMVPGDVTDNAANHGTLYAAVGRTCRVGREPDRSQHRGCRNDH